MLTRKKQVLLNNHATFFVTLLEENLFFLKNLRECLFTNDILVLFTKL